MDTDHVPEMTFFENDGLITVLAEHFAGCTTDTVQVIRDYGLCQSAVRAVRRSLDWDSCAEKAVVSYYVMAEEEAVYTVEIWTSPANPAVPGDRLPLALRNASAGESWKTVDMVPENYRAGDPDDDFWAAGVVEQIHKTRVPLFLRKGFNNVEIKFLNGILAVEKIIFCREGIIPRASWMGPTESWRR